MAGQEPTPMNTGTKLEFQEGSEIFTPEGDKVGDLKRVVLDPSTKKITHLIVSKGTLFTVDKVLPVEWVASTNDKSVLLKSDHGDLEALPDFQEIYYVQPDANEFTEAMFPVGYASPLYWYPAYGIPGGTPFLPYENYGRRVRENIPDNTVALKEGARVLSADGDHVGNIEKVLTDPESERISHFVIKQGLLFKDRKLIPVIWVKEVLEDDVYLGVGTATLKKLPDYQP